MMSDKLDLVVFGATSFVGQIICQYLTSPEFKEEIRWAMAGRSLDKLKTLQENLGVSTKNIPLLIADSNDENCLLEICNQTKVIISTVGPYDLYGETLVRICCESGTDYCDLTGEMHWIKKMQERYENIAVQNGARIVHSCGFDSIPSDCGVFFLQQKSLERFNKVCSSVFMRVKEMKGTFSGGTIASLINITKKAIKDSSLRDEFKDPYSCCPKNHTFKVRQKNVRVDYDDQFSSWIGPFVMAAINTRIVHRSNALSQNSYGDEFTYEEASLFGDGKNGEVRAKKHAKKMKWFNLAIIFPLSRWILEKFILPKPGEGPTPLEQINGSFDLRFLGKVSPNESILVKVTGDRDPGYGSTAKMISQAAVCLSFDIDEKKSGGFWTPSTLMGNQLISRLIDNAGLTFTVVDK